MPDGYTLVDFQIDLATAVLSLPERHRLALALWASGYSLREIAPACGCSHAWVGKMIQESTARLRKALADNV